MPKSTPTTARPFFLFLRNKPMNANRKPSPQRTKLTMLRIGTQQITRPISAKIKPAMPSPFFLFCTIMFSSIFHSLNTCRAQLLIVNNKAKIVYFFKMQIFFYQAPKIIASQSSDCHKSLPAQPARNKRLTAIRKYQW